MVLCVTPMASGHHQTWQKLKKIIFMGEFDTASLHIYHEKKPISLEQHHFEVLNPALTEQKILTESKFQIFS